MKRIIRLSENDLTKLIKRILVESELNEPNVTSENYYESFDSAYSFMNELDGFLNDLAPSDRVCDKNNLKMLNRLYNTAHYMVLGLMEKYKGGLSLPADRSFPPNSNDEMINNFIKKYDHLPDKKFYEFAELLSKDIGVSVEEIGNKRREFIKNEYSKLLNPKWDEGRMKKDPYYNQAQEMFDIAKTWLDCCKKGYYNCDDDPPIKFNDDSFKYKEPNVTYEPIKKGGSNVPSDIGGEVGFGMNEGIKRLIRKHL
jgi:hypothetical protein